jgi:hypothetical protein
MGGRREEKIFKVTGMTEKRNKFENRERGA